MATMANKSTMEFSSPNGDLSAVDVSRHMQSRSEYLKEQKKWKRRQHSNSAVTTKQAGKNVRVMVWDACALEFRKLYATIVGKSTILIITAVNPKSYGGNLSLSTTYSSRFFAGDEYEAIKIYAKSSQKTVAAPPLINVLKTVTNIDKASIDEILELIVSDTSGKTIFVLLDEDTTKLINMTATELLDSQTVMKDGVPEIFSDLVGREFEFEIKITNYNFRSEYETFTVSRYAEIQHPPPELQTSGKAPAGCYEDGEHEPPLETSERQSKKARTIDTN
ncbi:Nucleic acid-binding OB-fold [Arabidopsis thaliana x Arabidopsis arenosa]|uniref:Nucleic acid-binding OB-fold n=1 Tax=Arabidopsis thaliana x Arabidopsis arenosa TaxID=1240361 RepID=A0A8T2A842_9BRAS|nr:Nucleic acid-binding OB-fold [Arabidopsis thaliana x Arabidopsis arenosa]